MTTTQKNRVVLYSNPKLDYEYDFLKNNDHVIRGINYILENLGLDLKKNNPLTKFVSRGDTVIIKPNFVTIMHHHHNLRSELQNCITTNRSIIKPLIEYAFNAVGSEGKIIIVDSPLEASNFDNTMKKLGIDQMIEQFIKKGYPINLLDLRDCCVVPKVLLYNIKFGKRSLNIGLFIRKKLLGDPEGYTVVNMKDKSHFHNKTNNDKLRFYKPCFKGPLQAHSTNKHCYCLPNTVLKAKLIINLPKMKTHRIAGVTLSIKNNIGLLNKKIWLPHYSEGYPPHGDQYDTKPDLKTRIQHFLRTIPLWHGNSIFIRFPQVDHDDQQIIEPMHNGSWEGNDTLWRTILDTAKIIEYADSTGTLQDTPQRIILSILDGIVAGEGEGPLGASPKKCNLIMGSFNMYNLDITATQIMGFDVDKIRYLKNRPRDGIEVIKNIEQLPSFNFKAPDKWQNLEIYR